MDKGATKTQKIDSHILELPFITGFDHSRPDENHKCSNTKNPKDYQFYLTPSNVTTRQERYRMQYDHYSLGLLLFGITGWNCFQKWWQEDLVKRAKPPKSLAEYSQALKHFHKSMRNARTAGLRYHAGDIYCEAVLYCLGCTVADDNTADARAT